MHRLFSLSQRSSAMLDAVTINTLKHQLAGLKRTISIELSSPYSMTTKLMFPESLKITKDIISESKRLMLHIEYE
jgi:hypothetical protein